VKFCQQAGKEKKSAFALTLNRFEIAEREYEKRLREGEIDIRVLVAKGVKVCKARQIICEIPRYFFEIEFEGTPSNHRTRGDLFLIKKNDMPQTLAVMIAGSRFEDFRTKNGGFFSPGQEYGVFDGRIRHPSMTFFSRFQQRESLNATVLLEVEFEPRSLQTMHTYCLHYFRKPCVRAVLLLKYSPPRADNPSLFAAVAVLYRRAPGCTPHVTDAVSFGTVATPAASLAASLPDIAAALRVLPPAPCAPALLRGADPWAPALRPFLAVPAEDLRHLGDGPREGEVRLDLWVMLTCVEGFRWPLVEDAGGRPRPRNLLPA
jgi:hypothetical protein